MAVYPTTPSCNGAILEGFEPTVRPTDVFCTTAAKCGQTWLLTLLHHLRNGARDTDFGLRDLLTATPWLEFPIDLADPARAPYDTAARLAELERLPDPRVFKMHVVWDEIPRPPGSKARIVTVTRDLCDLPYSMYQHLRNLRPGPWASASDDFDAYFETWMEFGFAFRFIASLWPHRNDPDVLWLRYVDMHRDLPREARRLADFLGWAVDDATIERAAALVGFDRMQETERAHNAQHPTHEWRDGSQFFREGSLGKNRSRLSASQIERIIARARETLEPDCLQFMMAHGDR
jgi:hypothetical protein